MNISDDEALSLAKATRSACDQYATEARVRAVAYEWAPSRPSGFDAEFWRVLCRQIGVSAIAVPESLGGAGFGATALGVVAHELGRSLAPVPFLPSVVLATGLMLDCAELGTWPFDETLLAALLSGDRTAAAVLTDDGGAWGRAAVAITASPEPDGHHAMLSGAARHVLHGGAADDLVVVADVDGRPALFLVAAAAQASLDRQSEDVLDPTRPMATIQFRDTRALLISAGAPVDGLIHQRVQRAVALLTAEQVGANERVLELATEYARQRHQFGRAIGSFQAVKHQCADLLIGLEWSRSASRAALEAADDDPAGAAAELSWRSGMAKAVCSESLRIAAHANLQIHGGIGFTWEGSAHLYLRRARTDEVILGAPGLHWDTLTEELGML